MMKHILKISLIFIFLFTEKTSACSFEHGFHIGKPYLDFIKGNGDNPDKPRVKKIFLKRASGGDGKYDSCFDIAYLKIILDESNPFRMQSYKIELIKGQFPKEVLPDSFITPVRLSDGEVGFMFVWSDFELEPIDATFEIRQLTHGNKLSKPNIIQVTDNEND